MKSTPHLYKKYGYPVCHCGKQLSKRQAKQCKKCALKGNNRGFKKNIIPWNKGTKGVMVAWNKGKEYTQVTGAKHFNWKGGISKIDKLCRTMAEYYQWRSDVFLRDKWTCRTCNKNDCYVTAHHIEGFSKIIKDNNIKTRSDARKCIKLWDIDNGVTLCEDCHKLTDNYKGKKSFKNTILK